MRKMGPILILLLVMLLGAGLGYAYGASSVEIVDTAPWQMHKSYQGIYVQAVADAFAKDGNAAKAVDSLSFLCQTNGGLQTAVQEATLRYGSNLESKTNLDKLNQLIATGNVRQNEAVAVCDFSGQDQLAGYGRYGWIGILLVAVVIVGYGVWVVIRSSEEAPSVGGPAVAAGERGKSTVPTTIGGMVVPPAKSVAAAGAKISAAIEKTDFSTAGMEAPIVQFMTTYLHGDDLYDDSFSVETSSGEFFGETGVGISETIGGAGEAKKVAALEVWLFDKNDIRTVTKVLMTDHAFNDDAIRARLAPKGEAVLVKAGDKITLETASLRIQARIVDMAYGTGPLPPNSFFERITIELAAWKKKEGQAAPAGGATPGAGLPSIGS